MSSALASTDSQGRVAVYSGTFDPITLGHEDVARRASLLFDDVIIAVAIAHHKKTRFTLQERLDMAAEAAARMPGRVRVLPFDGLIMDFCRQHGATAVVRGIRNLTDFDYEAQMADEPQAQPGGGNGVPVAASRVAMHLEHPGARDIATGW